jgi:hypothetical protein
VYLCTSFEMPTTLTALPHVQPFAELSIVHYMMLFRCVLFFFCMMILCMCAYGGCDFCCLVAAAVYMCCVNPYLIMPGHLTVNWQLGKKKT